MMKRYYYLVLCLFFQLSVGWVHATTFHCTNTSNLEAAVASAVSGDVIELAAGSYYPRSTLVARVDMTIQPDASSSGAVKLYGAYISSTYSPLFQAGDTSHPPIKITIRDIDFMYGNQGVELCNVNSAEISDSSFIYWRSEGLSSASRSANVTLDNLYFYSAPSYIASSNVELKNSTFKKSNILFSPHSGLMTSCSLDESPVDLYGADYVKMEDNRITSASKGITISYGDYIEIVNNTIESCDIGIEQENVAPHLEIHSNTIKNNEYGLYLWSDDSVLGVNIDIHNNTINQNDTGLYMTRMDAATTIHANWMAGNDVGVYAEQCDDPQVYNNLIINGRRGFVGVATDTYFLYNTVANHSSGGILSAAKDSSFINNNISWGNAVGISKSSSSTAYAVNNVAYNNRSTDFSGSISTVINFRIDPLFKNPSGDDYHLTYPSGCIGIALHMSVSDDLDGRARELISGSGPGPKFGAEVGCYELYITNRG